MSDLSHEGTGMRMPGEADVAPGGPPNLAELEGAMAQVGAERPHLNTEEKAQQEQAQALIRQAMEQAKAMPPAPQTPSGAENAPRMAPAPGENQAALALQKVAAMVKSPFAGIMNLLKMIGRWIVK